MQALCQSIVQFPQRILCISIEFKEHWCFQGSQQIQVIRHHGSGSSSASSAGTVEMYRRSSSTCRNRAHWLELGSAVDPRDLCFQSRRHAYGGVPRAEQCPTVRHRERAPTGPAPLPMMSTPGRAAPRGARRSLPAGGAWRRRRGHQGRSSVVSRRSLTSSHAASSASLLPLGSAFALCSRAAGVLGIHGPRR